MSKATLTRNAESRRAAILYELWKEGPISRGHLAERMELNLPMVSSCVQDLIKEAVLIEEGFATSTGGRKAQLLDVNARQGGIVAVELSRRGLRTAAADMKGRLSNQVTQPLHPGSGMSQILKTIFAAVSYQAEFLKEDEKLELRRIGFVTSGPVNDKAGVSVGFPGLPEWTDVPIAELLADEFNVPAVAGNHVVCTTLAEIVSGRHRDLNDLLYLHLGSGLGLGMVVDGGVIRGRKTTIGEFGHLPIPCNEIECYCGNNGCLETLAGAKAQIRQAEEAIAQGRKSSIPQHVDDNGNVTWEAIVRAAEMGDDLAGEIIDRAAERIGCHLAGVVNLLSPEAVIFGGLMAEDGERLLRGIKDATLRCAIPAVGAALRFDLSSFGSQAGVAGAVAIALHTHYNSFLDE